MEGEINDGDADEPLGTSSLFLDSYSPQHLILFKRFTSPQCHPSQRGLALCSLITAIYLEAQHPAAPLQYLPLPKFSSDVAGL